MWIDECWLCDGSGKRDILSGAKCHECNGKGYIEHPEPEFDDDEPIGSCANCGANIYEFTASGLCDQCEWFGSGIV